MRWDLIIKLLMKKYNHEMLYKVWKSCEKSRPRWLHCYSYRINLFCWNTRLILSNHLIFWSIILEIVQLTVMTGEYLCISSWSLLIQRLVPSTPQLVIPVFKLILEEWETYSIVGFTSNGRYTSRGFLHLLSKWICFLWRSNLVCVFQLQLNSLDIKQIKSESM